MAQIIYHFFKNHSYLQNFIGKVHSNARIVEKAFRIDSEQNEIKQLTMVKGEKPYKL